MYPSEIDAIRGEPDPVPAPADPRWTRSDCLALARQSCVFCYGLGLRPGRGGRAQPCACVFRAVFRACYSRFLQVVSQEKHVSRVSLESNPGRTRRSTWSLKNEEYIADFCLVSRRTLDEAQYRIFKYHYLLGADWSLCCRKLATERGDFFHDVYRIQQKLGKVFRELEPYPLYPLEGYFGQVHERKPTAAVLPFPVRSEPAPAPKKILKFPIRRAG